jgi:hypothetical protein
MVLITLIAPELMLGFAARQYVVAHWFAKSTPCFLIADQISAQIIT